MRPAPRQINKSQMPSVADAARMIQRTVDHKWARLGDASIGSLVMKFSEGSPAWLTGSSVWLSAVFGLPPDLSGDLDVVFADRNALERFTNGVVKELNRRLPDDMPGRYELSVNALGGARILHPDGRGVIDAWHLGDNESIGELVMAFPGGDHVHCAYYISQSPSSGCLFRIVDVPKSFEKMKRPTPSYYGAPTPVIFGTVTQAKDSYPGKATAPSLGSLLGSLKR